MSIDSWEEYRDTYCRCPKCGKDEVTECECYLNDETEEIEKLEEEE